MDDPIAFLESRWPGKPPKDVKEAFAFLKISLKKEAEPAHGNIMASISDNPDLPASYEIMISLPDDPRSFWFSEISK